MSDSFAEIGISMALATGLRRAGIIQPTAIQSAVIPLALAGKDVIGQSATGTGKTLAYLLPLLQKIHTAQREMQAIILAPTHELAMQIYREAEKLASNAGLPVTAAPVIGQVNITRQIDSLKARPHIIVGSSGRIFELIQKRKITAHTIRTIIIDEADKLLDDNNWESVKAVVKTTLKKERQLMFFSATITRLTLDRAKELSADPELVAAQDRAEVPPDIFHMYFLAEQRDKIEVLRKLATHLKVERGLAFLNKSDDVETAVAKLNYHGIKTAGIYGSSGKADRKTAIEDFRSGKVRLLIASDLAARGLDIPDIACVFNLDLPEDPEGYLHRVGRTGRAGQSGWAISIVTSREEEQIARFARVLKISIAAKRLFKGNIIDDAEPVKVPARPIKYK